MARDLNYQTLAKAKIQEKRNAVISACKKNGELQEYTIAQELEVEEGKRKINVFLKGAIHVEGLDGLYELRDALNVAITAIENHDADDADWDEVE